MSSNDADVHISDNRALHRYEIAVRGELAGFAEYRPPDAEPAAVVFVHTVIDPRFEGQGLGSRLARFALDDVRSRALQAVPVCEFIAGWLRKHPDYQDLVSAQDRARFGI